MKVSIDANIFISIINEEAEFETCKKILNLIEKREIEGQVSTIVIAEVLVGYYQNQDFDQAKRFSSYVKNLFQIIKVDLKIASEAARIKAEKNINLPDAVVISSSKNAKYLITLDEKVLRYDKKRIVNPVEFWEKVKN
jgi:predicted nucleic acid-binding protein